MSFTNLFGKRARGVVALLTVLVLAVPLAPFERQAAALSLSEEQELGAKILEAIRHSMPMVEDGEVLAYVQSVGKRIAQQVGTTSYRHQFFVVDEPVPNAFAVPGGYIFIYRGLIEMMSSEGELASIISHEMAHVQARHIHRQIEQQKILSVASIAGVLAGVLLGMKGGGGSGGSALAIGSMAGASSAALQYSREYETEADQLGFRYLCAAGYDPQDMASMMQKLDQAKWLQNSKIPSYLMTHPALGDRVQYLQDLVREEKRKKSAARPPATGDFLIMQTALIADYTEPMKALDRFESGAQKGDKASVYGLGRLYLRVNRTADAIPKLQEAARLMPSSPFVLCALGDAYYRANRLKEAQKCFETALDIDSSTSIAHFRLGVVLQEQGQKEQALDHFQQIEELAPMFPDLDYQFGVVLGQVNKLGLAHYHLGRYYRHKQNWELALTHYKKAKVLILDAPAKMDEINAQIKELEKLKKEMPFKPRG